MSESSSEIPACSSEASPCLAEPSTGPVPPQRKPGVLVVDDDAAVRFLLDVGLRRYGFAVWQAADGQEALHVYQQERSDIDLVLLDVRMPGLDGPQTLLALRGLNPQLPCCFMTGQAGNYRQDELLGLGAARVFAKPFQLTEIIQTLAALLGHSLTGPPEPST